jgi:hypothetical protein
MKPLSVVGNRYEDMIPFQFEPHPGVSGRGMLSHIRQCLLDDPDQLQFRLR